MTEAEKRAALREDAPLNQDEFGALEMLLADAQWREFPQATLDTLQRARSKLRFQAGRTAVIGDGNPVKKRGDGGQVGPSAVIGMRVRYREEFGRECSLPDEVLRHLWLEERDKMRTNSGAVRIGPNAKPIYGVVLIRMDAAERALGEPRPPLHDMTVYFEEATEVPSGRQAFRCQAEDEAHAREQCLNAYPDAHIWCVDQPREAMKGDV